MYIIYIIGGVAPDQGSPIAGGISLSGAFVRVAYNNEETVRAVGMGMDLGVKPDMTTDYNLPSLRQTSAKPPRSTMQRLPNTARNRELAGWRALRGTGRPFLAGTLECIERRFKML